MWPDFLKFKKSLGYAWKGCQCMWKENNFRIQSCVAVLVLIQALVFNITAVEMMLVILCIGMVLSMEMVNTALERLCDYVQPNYDPRIGQIKDLSAGAVLLISTFSALLGLCIFVPYWSAWWQSGTLW
ncbi:MAG: diacylglycerol kinase family protein [Cytophagaceae bacterium]|jgi:diacylglycerol kinase|nr:diacylglycerol kinase family protein [Cytophagaceae bacterium]